MRIGIAFDLKSDSPVVGGDSADWQDEFDSPETIAAIADALRANGHTVVELGDGRELIEKLLADPPELVFNIAEGHGIARSREARVPAVCEMLGVPYVGSDPLTLAATLDKDVARRMAMSAGLTVPAGGLVTENQIPPVRFPAIVKPAWEGSSKGISLASIVNSTEELAALVREHQRRYRQPLLVEEFVDGEEITVGLLGPADEPDVLGVMRILPRQPTGERFIYDQEVKKDCLTHLIYECPAQIPATTTAEVLRCAVRAYEVLGCRDFARVDFRVRDGVPYFLEVNPLPGLNPETGDIAMIARDVGMSYNTFIGRIVNEAIARLKL